MPPHLIEGAADQDMQFSSRIPSGASQTRGTIPARQGSARLRASKNSVLGTFHPAWASDPPHSRRRRTRPRWPCERVFQESRPHRQLPRRRCRTAGWPAQVRWLNPSAPRPVSSHLNPIAFSTDGTWHSKGLGQPADVSGRRPQGGHGCGISEASVRLPFCNGVASLYPTCHVLQVIPCLPAEWRRSRRCLRTTKRPPKGPCGCARYLTTRPATMTASSDGSPLAAGGGTDDK